MTEQETDTPSSLDPRFEPLALAVAAGDTIKAAADKCGIPLSTAYHTTSGEPFKQRVIALRTEATQAALGQMTDGLVTAVATIKALMAETNEPKIRLDAAKAMLTNHAALANVAELRERLEKLEQAMNN